MLVKATLDRADAERIAAGLRDLPQRLRGPTVKRALRRALGTVRTETTRMVRAEVPRLRAKTVSGQMAIQLTASGLEGDVIVRARPIPLVEYAGRQTRLGVTVEVKKGRKLIRHAFIATMKSGHRGIFVRRGKARLPIKELFGPAIVDLVTNHLEKARARGASELLEQLRREIDWRKHGAAGFGAGV